MLFSFLKSSSYSPTASLQLHYCSHTGNILPISRNPLFYNASRYPLPLISYL
nr:MAG TPA: hypothetical protein [Siphoviridae sp. ctweK11]